MCSFPVAFPFAQQSCRSRVTGCKQRLDCSLELKKNNKTVLGMQVNKLQSVGVVWNVTDARCVRRRNHLCSGSLKCPKKVESKGVYILLSWLAETKASVLGRNLGSARGATTTRSLILVWSNPTHKQVSSHLPDLRTSYILHFGVKILKGGVVTPCGPKAHPVYFWVFTREKKDLNVAYKEKFFFKNVTIQKATF